MEEQLILYMRGNHSCSFCEKVRAEVERLGLTVLERDINEPDVVEELIERGGKKQVPYLVDVENAVEMYESEDIIAYVAEHFGAAQDDVLPI